jgi:hypothetical protein
MLAVVVPPKMVFIGAVPPLTLKTDHNPGGLPLSVFDGLHAAWWRTGRSSTRIPARRALVALRSSPSPLSSN